MCARNVTNAAKMLLRPMNKFTLVTFNKEENFIYALRIEITSINTKELK